MQSYIHNFGQFEAGPEEARLIAEKQKKNHGIIKNLSTQINNYQAQKMNFMTRLKKLNRRQKKIRNKGGKVAKRIKRRKRFLRYKLSNVMNSVVNLKKSLNQFQNNEKIINNTINDMKMKAEIAELTQKLVEQVKKDAVPDDTESEATSTKSEATTDRSGSFRKRQQILLQKKEKSQDPDGMRVVEKCWLDKINKYRLIYGLKKMRSKEEEKNDVILKLEDYLLNKKVAKDIRIFPITYNDMTGRPIEFWINEAEKYLENKNKKINKEMKYGLLMLHSNLKVCEVAAKKGIDGVVYIGIKTDPPKFKKKMLKKYMPIQSRKTVIF